MDHIDWRCRPLPIGRLLYYADGKPATDAKMPKDFGTFVEFLLNRQTWEGPQTNISVVGSIQDADTELR
jgi:hypothetical protein